jgi:hypothetical protein
MAQTRAFEGAQRLPRQQERTTTMNKNDALKLRPGEWIMFGDSMWSAKVRTWRRGTVITVTPRGGLRVRVEGGNMEWVHYHHVLEWGAAAAPLDAPPKLTRPPLPPLPY